MRVAAFPINAAYSVCGLDQEHSIFPGHWIRRFDVMLSKGTLLRSFRLIRPRSPGTDVEREANYLRSLAARPRPFQMNAKCMFVHNHRLHQMFGGYTARAEHLRPLMSYMLLCSCQCVLAARLSRDGRLYRPFSDMLLDSIRPFPVMGAAHPEVRLLCPLPVAYTRNRAFDD